MNLLTPLYLARKRKRLKRRLAKERSGLFLRAGMVGIDVARFISVLVGTEKGFSVQHSNQMTDYVSKGWSKWNGTDLGTSRLA